MTQKHTIAGLLGVVFIAVIASNSVFEGNTNKEDEKAAPAASVSSTDAPPKVEEGTSTANNIAAAQAALKALS